MPINDYVITNLKNLKNDIDKMGEIKKDNVESMINVRDNNDIITVLISIQHMIQEN